MLRRAFKHLLPQCHTTFDSITIEMDRLTNIEMEDRFNSYREFGLYNAVQSITNLEF
jgi:hypothetical protein